MGGAYFRDGPRTSPWHVTVEPAVVMVPGLGLDARAWERVTRALSPVRSHVVLLPSLGRRPARGRRLDVPAQATRLLNELDRLACGPTLLVGHSASSPVVVEAATRTAAVLGLVLLGPVTDPRAATWPRMLGQWARTAVHERLWEGPELVPQYARTGVVGMIRGMNDVRPFRTDQALRTLATPTVVIRGEYDRIAASAWMDDLAGAGARVVTVPGAAHMLPLTHPQSVVSAVRELICDLDPDLRPG